MVAGAVVFALLLLQDDVQTHFDHALALSTQHQDDEAIAEFRKALELRPGLYEASLNLGILLLRNQRPAEALVVLKQAAEAKPKELRPNLFYAQAMLDLGDGAQAEVFFTRALEIDANSTPAQLGLGRALLKQDKLEGAATRFRAAGSKEDLEQAGIAYEHAGDLPHAVAIYREVHASARVKALYLAAADSAVTAKQPAEAAEWLKQALAADPNDFDVRMGYGRLLRDQHQLLPAAQQFYAAAQMKPDSAPAWNELASALIVSEKYAEGLAALDRVRALGKEIPGDMYLRAITLDKLKQKPLALSAYRQFLDADKGGHPDQEFLSRQRIRIIESELKK